MNRRSQVDDLSVTTTDGPTADPQHSRAVDLQNSQTEALQLNQEELRVDTTTERAGTVRARKHVDTETVHSRVERGTEHADTEREPVLDGDADSGQVETLPDGSISIPVFEEQIVVTKRLVVRERVVVRKHTVFEEHEVTADLRRERLEVETDGDVMVSDEADRGSGDSGRLRD